MPSKNGISSTRILKKVKVKKTILLYRHFTLLVKFIIFIYIIIIFYRLRCVFLETDRYRKIKHFEQSEVRDAAGTSAFFQCRGRERQFHASGGTGRHPHRARALRGAWRALHPVATSLSAIHQIAGPGRCWWRIQRTRSAQVSLLPEYRGNRPPSP